ncbi:MAG: TIGR04282 family arsenosugar biosynthesis glycosyltransferase [bacterium]
MREPTLDVLSYYEAFFQPGMVDISSSLPGGQGSGAETSYPPATGLRSLRGLIAARYPGLTADDVVVTNGASEALAASALAFVSRGTPVMAALGSYPSFTSISARLGAEIRPGDGECPMDGVMLLNNPTVPGGQLLDVRAAARLADRLNTRLICDEVYLDLRDGHSAPAATLSRSAISIGDVSKPLGLGGLRIGWAATRDRDALASISREVQLLSGGPSTLAMEAAATAMAGYELTVSRLVESAAENAQSLFVLLDRAGWTYERPAMGWTFVARSRSGDVPSAGVLREHRLFAVPSEVFGIEGGLRLSVFTPPNDLETLLNLPHGRGTGTLVVLAKSPARGQSKTRLAAMLGEDAANRLAEAFLRDTMALALEANENVLVAFTPREARCDFERLAGRALLTEQPDGDLGQRIASAVATALDCSGRAVLIGTDTPDLPSALVADAFRALDDADLVLGPADDGGFYLLGTSRPLNGLFDGVAWSTATVCETVLANAEKHGYRVKTLSRWGDIDDIGSLSAAARRIEVSRAAPATRRVLADVKLEVLHGA